MIKLMAKKNSGTVEKSAAKEDVSEPSGVVVSGAFAPKRLKLPTGRRARTVYIGVGVCVVVVAAVAVVAQLQKDEPGAPVATTVTDAHAKVISGDFAGAEKSLNEALKNTEDAKEKATIELGIAEALVNDEKYDEAITHAQTSNKLAESDRAYGLIGFAASQTEKWQIAADSYAKAAELSTGEDAAQTQQYYKNLENEARKNL